MTKTNISNLLDKIFITICTFLIIYAWINFYIRDLWTTFFLSLIFTFASVFLLFYFLGKKQEKKWRNKEYQTNVEKNFFAFRLMNKKEKLTFLKSILSKDCECQIKDDNLIVKTPNETHQIIIAVYHEKLTQFDLINLIEKLEKNIDVLKIICCDTDQNLNTRILKNLKIEIVTKKKLYDEYFLPHNILPDCSNLNDKTERKKYMEIMKNFFIPSKAKSYFWCGLILIFSSIILPYRYYYLIFGTILLLFSIICKLQPLFKS